MESIYEYIKSDEIIAMVEHAFNEFKIEYTPQIIFSDELPPILHNKSKTEIDNLPIEGLLGAYNLTTKEIIIYLQGINLSAEKLLIKSGIPIQKIFSALLQIVIIHECGHYWYQNVQFNDKIPSVKTNADEIDEWIAQMFTFYCIKGNVELNNTFDELMKIQPDCYKISNHDKNIITELFKEIVEEVRAEKKSIQSWESFENNKVEHIRLWVRIKEITDYIETKMKDSQGKLTYADLCNDAKFIMLGDVNKYNL